jgi:hypothetical protein
LIGLVAGWLAAIAAVAVCISHVAVPQ